MEFKVLTLTFVTLCLFTAVPGTSVVGNFNGAGVSSIRTLRSQGPTCTPTVVNGTLGSGDPNFTGTQSSGLQTGRLNRNGIASSCAAPKTCLIFDATGSRAYDAYQFPNQSGADACVTIDLTVLQAGGNYQSNAYLNTYDPSSICTGYLGDPGLSSGVPPTPTTFSVVVPAGQTLIVVVHTTNPGETGGQYTLTVSGDLCFPFDVCLQDDSNPGLVFLGNTLTGEYRFCCNGMTYGGVATVTQRGSTVTFQHNTADRRVLVKYDGSVFKGSASVQSPPGTIRCTITDRDTRNNTCSCS